MQAAFVTEYAVDGNATQAAIRAGANPNSAHVTASKWLKTAKIRSAVTDAQRRVLARTEITAQMILERAWAVAQTDAKDRSAHLAIAARAFPEFKDGITVNNDNRKVELPAGTTIDDLRALRDELK